MALSVSPTADRGQSNSSAAALMNVEDLSALLSCSSRSIRRMADSGRMPRPVRLGSLVRWRRSDIDAWVADGCPRSGGASR
ncbi:MAG: helix-turn-helix domain-containing protein [Planctomycetota bacterium]|nr:helix-turn-helix domain-containing protein [Planctomycetota bacterium]